MVKRALTQEHKAEFRLGSLVLVRWLDAAADGTWHNEEELADVDAHEVVSVGWLERETDRALVLSGAFGDYADGEREYLSVQAIPKGMVVGVYRLPVG